MSNASKIRHMAAGAATCAIDASSALWCWGRNQYGTVGDGTTTQRNTRQKVGLTGKVWDVAARSYHTCSIVENNGVRDMWCWGRNIADAIGQEKVNQNYTTPQKVNGFTGAHRVCTGEAHTCGLFPNGRIKCIGFNGDRQLGTWFSASSTKLGYWAEGVAPAQQIACTYRNTCAVLRDKRVMCWGRGSYGVNGRGDKTTSGVPKVVSGIGDVHSIAAGANHVCTINTKNQLYCWGSGGNGQIGDGAKTDRPTPVLVSTYSAPARVAAGQDATCATVFRYVTFDQDKKTFGTQCWGRNNYGQLGNGNKTDLLKPTTLFYKQGGSQEKETNWVKGMESGTGGLVDFMWTPCALQGGTAKCWGRGTFGNIGNGSTSDRTSATGISGF